ncbi:MAG: helix-turn-helix domain-containing protein [Bacteroidetes bacterium]|nr:helix-turn-helix domain-containing protein [Bacteroidota bacterium]
MLNRIKQIIDKEKLSSTQFASEIGVQRSALSHVLSGRNNPSLDFMMKIKNRYPDINLDWLLLGKGKMTGSIEKKETAPAEIPKIEPKKDASKEIQFRVKQDEVDEVVESKRVKPKEEQQKHVKSSADDEKDADSPVKIILLYPDDTYKTFNPRN